MALQEFYNTNDDIAATIIGNNWFGQTWTTESAYSIASVKLKLYRGATGPDNVTVSIRATSAGLPTGGDLTSGSIAGSTLTQGSPGDFIEIPLTPFALSDATKYAIILNVDNLSCSWRVDNSAPSYAGGNGCSSTNAGVGWSTGGWDSMFETHDSSGTFSELSGTIAATTTVTGNMILGTLSELSGTIAAQSTVSGNLGSVTVEINTPTSIIKRLFSVGNNQVWFESI